MSSVFWNTPGHKDSEKPGRSGTGTEDAQHCSKQLGFGSMPNGVVVLGLTAFLLSMAARLILLGI